MNVIIRTFIYHDILLRWIQQFSCVTLTGALYLAASLLSWKIRLPLYYYTQPVCFRLFGFFVLRELFQRANSDASCQKKMTVKLGFNWKSSSNGEGYRVEYLWDELCCIDVENWNGSYAAKLFYETCLINQNERLLQSHAKEDYHYASHKNKPLTYQEPSNKWANRAICSLLHFNLE